MPAPDSDSYVTLSSEEELGDHSHRQAPPGRKGGTLAAPALRPQRRRTARGLLSPGSQAAAQNSTAAYVLDQQEGSTRASSRLAAGRASGRAAGRQQRQRPGQAAALAELQQARAGRVAAVVAHPSGQRRSRAHAVVEDSSSSGSGSPPAGSDSYVAAEPWPRRRACRAAGGARSRTRFLRGGRDYAESGSDTGVLLCTGSAVICREACIFHVMLHGAVGSEAWRPRLTPACPPVCCRHGRLHCRRRRGRAVRKRRRRPAVARARRRQPAKCQPLKPRLGSARSQAGRTRTACRGRGQGACGGLSGSGGGGSLGRRLGG
jgi:hypothetical protein